MDWRIQAEGFLDLANVPTAGVIQIQCFDGCTALGRQSLDLIAAKPEVLWPKLLDGMKQSRILARCRINRGSPAGFVQIAPRARQCEISPNQSTRPCIGG